MNREIKFRAWLISKKIMTPTFTLVDLAYSYDGGYCIPGDNDLLIGNLPSYYKGDADPDYIVMQYTGLKDKDGREIFEGDIVNDQSKTLGTHIIQYANWRLENCNCCQLWGGYYVPSPEDLEVIGNIYENPQLIPEKI